MDGFRRFLGRLFRHQPRPPTLDCINAALASLQTRGAIRKLVQLETGTGTALHCMLVSPRGNFGHVLQLRTARSSLFLSPACPPFAPFGDNSPQDPILDPALEDYRHWVLLTRNGEVTVASPDKLALANTLHGLLLQHPVDIWFRQIFAALAAGKFVNSATLNHFVAFGVLQYVRGISHRDPLQEKIEPALETLCRIDEYFRATRSADSEAVNLESETNSLVLLKKTLFERFPVAAGRIMRKPPPEPMVKKKPMLDLSLPGLLR